MTVSQSSTVWWYAKWLKIRWWKLKETSCQEIFRQEVTRILGGKDGLPDEWDKTAQMLRTTAKTMLGVTFGKRKGEGRHDGGMRKYGRA